MNWASYWFGFCCVHYMALSRHHVRLWYEEITAFMALQVFFLLLSHPCVLCHQDGPLLILWVDDI